MPQALAAAIVAAVGLTATAAAIATAVLTLAISIGLSALVNSLFGRGVGKPSDGQQVIRASIQSRRRYYGQSLVAGALTFEESANGTLYILTTNAHTKINQTLAHRLNNKEVTVNGSGLVTDARFKGAVKIFTRDGTEGQTAYSQLTAAFPAWTSSHRQRSCANSLLICGPIDAEEFSEVYEGSRPPIHTREIEGSLIYDPRLDDTQQIGTDGSGDPIMGSGSHRLDDNSTWEYSDNAALVIGDYWGHEDGYGAGYDNVNWTNIAAEADICEQQVTTVDSRTIDRWRIWGGYALSDDDRQAVLSEMLKACDGFTWQDKDGKLNLRVGRWIEPATTLTVDHIIGITASKGPKGIERVNEVKIIYTDPNFDYQEQEASPQVDQPNINQIGREETSEMTAYYAPDHNQAARLGKRAIKRLGERWNVSVVTNLYGLNLLGERFCKITLDELGFDQMSFEMTAPPRIDFMNGTLVFSLVEVRSSDFDFNAATEEGDPPSQPGSTFVAATVEVPQNLSLSSVDVEGETGNGVGILATWDATTRPGLLFEAQYKKSADNDWLPVTVSQNERRAVTGVVSSGVEHEVRVRSLTISGRPSAWTSPVSITPTASSSVPNQPSDFSATGGGGKVDLSWRMPNSASLDHVKIYRHTSDDFSNASQIGSNIIGGLGATINYEDSGLSPDTYFYWIEAFNSAGQGSGETASVSAAST